MELNSNASSVQQQNEEQMSCRWRFCKSSGPKTHSLTTLDIVFHDKESTTKLNNLDSWFTSDVFPSQSSKNVVAGLLRHHCAPSKFAAFKVLLPRSSGYWCRQNIVRQRFLDCDVKSVRDFAKARQYYDAFPLENVAQLSLHDILNAALVAIELHAIDSASALESELASLEREVLNRLSLPLLLANPIPQYRLAILHGHHDWSVTDMIYQAAQDMDIEMFVLAQPGHFMEDGPYNSFRKAFIPIDVTVNDSLTQRIVEALRDYPVQMDGIVAFTDMGLIPAAYAAQALGLPTQPPSLFETCRDKYLTRMLDVPKDFECVRVEGSSGAADFVKNVRSKGKLTFPLIVKPCAGFGSLGVRKVNNEIELLDAAAKANITDYGRGDLITIESYLDGPEVDANFILWDGAVRFLEISDQFPAEADLDPTTTATNFLETELFLPSALPASEQSIVKESMLRILEKLGCRSGIFHMEARMRNSSMEYRIDDGLQDLALRTEELSREPECVLIENNCRPPGTNSNSAILHTYGVEFYALHLLMALNDGARITALSVPFISGPQYHLDLISIPVTKGGIFASKDATGDFLNRHPELKRKVIRCGCYYRYGDEVPDPSSGYLFWIAFFLVASPTSRKDVLLTSQRIRKDFNWIIVPSRDDLNGLDYSG